jgi:hypothetical protein
MCGKWEKMFPEQHFFRQRDIFSPIGNIMPHARRKKAVTLWPKQIIH